MLVNRPLKRQAELIKSVFFFTTRLIKITFYIERETETETERVNKLLVPVLKGGMYA